MAALKATSGDGKAPGTTAVAASASEEEEIDDEEPMDQDGAPPPPPSTSEVSGSNKKSVPAEKSGLSKDKPEPVKDTPATAEGSSKKETVRQSASIGLGLDISVTVVQKKKELPTGLATNTNLFCWPFVKRNN